MDGWAGLKGAEVKGAVVEGVVRVNGMREVREDVGKA
jgi:ribosome-associated protein YbcJ (S4-like RNA binding protein)